MATQKLNELLKRSLLEVQQLRAALEKAEAKRSEPIAIVGMACRAPGGVRDPQGYWALLAEGRDAVGPLPERWCPDAIYDPDPDAPGKTYVRQAGCLDDVDRFDADFFGISPREARAMDPQQRLALEVSWESLEGAGIVPTTLSESRTGVYMGAMRADYGAQDPSLESLDGYRGTGVANSVLAGRISYSLGLQGPAIAVDTACSSSLVALHLACAGLRAGECNLALAGGVMVMSTPSLLVEFARLRASSPDGRCKAFSAEADGAGWAEGCGMVVLKRLSDAQRDGDRVWAVIRGSAMNQDGRSQGLTAPHGPSQTRLVQQALEASGLKPHEIDALEAHGTGTSLGDPIEAGALAEVFGNARGESAPVWLGSAKSNIGHSQAAAGVLGVIKMVLALQHEELPRTLHADNPSPHIDWDRSGLRLLRTAQPWPRDPARPRRAGVSSFGIGGTNAHLVLEEAPADEQGPPIETSDPHLPLVLSAKDAHSLRLQAARWADWISAHPDVPWQRVLNTAASRRAHFDHRIAVRGSGRGETVEALRDWAAGKPRAPVDAGRSLPSRRGPVFVFPGQGSQWRGMGRRLLQESPVFADSIERCDGVFGPLLGWSVSRLLAGEADEARPQDDRIDVIQPALFAMGVALSALWRSVGVEPTAVVGHSLGEVVAAVVSGALSLDDGARVVHARSTLLRSLSGTAGMASVAASEGEVAALLQEPEWSDLALAVVNSATSTVVGGPPATIDAWVEKMTARGTFARRIATDVTTHTHHVDAVVDRLRAWLASLSPRKPEIGLVSTVTGQSVEGADLGAEYWCRNLRSTVRLDLAIQHLIRAGHNVFIEVSPHPVLAMAVSSFESPSPLTVVGTLERDSGGVEDLRRNRGRLYVEGVAPRVRPSTPAALPTYAFKRERFWLDMPALPRANPRSEVVPASLEGHEAEVEGDDPRAQVRAALASVLRLPSATAIDESRSPVELGLDSLMALELARVLKQTGASDITAAGVLGETSVRALVERVAGEAMPGDGEAVAAAGNRPSWSHWLTTLHQPVEPRFRLLCFPYSGGTAAAFRDWPQGLPEDVEVVAVEFPGRGRRRHARPAHDLNTALGEILQELTDRPALPTLVFGHSLGAIVGFELAGAYAEAGGQVAHLFASGAAAPHLFEVAAWSRMDDETLLDHLEDMGLGPVRELRADAQLAAQLLRTTRSDLALAEGYRPGRRAFGHIPLTVFSGSGDAVAPVASVQAWERYAPEHRGIRHHEFPGGHGFIDTHRAKVCEVIAETVHWLRSEAHAQLCKVAPDPSRGIATEASR